MESLLSFAVCFPACQCFFSPSVIREKMSVVCILGKLNLALQVLALLGLLGIGLKW